VGLWVGIVNPAFGNTLPVLSDVFTIQKEYFAFFYTPLKLITSKIWYKTFANTASDAAITL
jgi:hypothetical protein